jgi:succinyl-CoA synthetase beta subunit
MKIHEYQGKEIFRHYGVAVPRGVPCKTAQEARDAAQRLFTETGTPVVVVKAQVHAGGRGKGKVHKGAEVVARGVEVIKGGAEAAGEAAARMLGGRLVTAQTGPEGAPVGTVFVEQGVAIARELYLGMLVDRDTRRIVVMASAEGGVDIEKVAEETPEKILKEWVDPVTGLQPFQARKLGFTLGMNKSQVAGFTALLTALYKLFVTEDCALLEVNPLIVTVSGEVMALDAKINFDENAHFRHAEWDALRDPAEENPTEARAKEAGLSYVALDGNIGCLVNGAGLAMATMDIVSHCGGRPANFLDVGGGASEEAVTKAFEIILESPSVRGIFVNIFGGIMKCDVIASGVINATRKLGLKVPLVVRLEGTNVDEGRRMLEESGLAITPASSMLDGARKIVQLVNAQAR